ncbi:MAG: carbohydrate ABC transporter permease [Propionibacteriaceae bacterium]|nr:carbohydrate ABC transporter permease [Propionibacteriaceae bacterium]
MTSLDTAAAPQARRHPTVKPHAMGIVKHVLLIAGSIAMVYPLLWLVVSSFKPNDMIFKDLSIFTRDLTLQNYVSGWTSLQNPFGTYILNSLVIAVLCIIGNLISCSLAAYAFARLKFVGRNVYFAIMLMTIMLPFQVVLVPQFTIYRLLGWINTILPLVVPKFLATDAFFVFLMVQFIRALPKEIYEAGQIDGANQFTLFSRITLPLMVPALATTSIFTFIWTWSDFFGPLLYLRIPDMFTVSVALKGFLDSQSTSDYGAMFAMSVVSLVPLFIVFMFGQKYLIKGFATTGIK